MPNDVAGAARRVAEDTRQNAPKERGFAISIKDALLLLPILDAVAAMPETDETRIERWARAFSRTDGYNPDVFRPSDTISRGSPWHRDRLDLARAAIALADAERVVEGSRNG